MSSELIKENGIFIYYLDFTNLKTLSAIQSRIEECRLFIWGQPENSLLTLTNVEGMHFNNEIRDAFTKFVKGNQPYVKAGAVIGLSGLMQIVYNGMVAITGRNIKAFKTKDEAIRYLVSR
jgi:hypothetical protein